MARLYGLHRPEASFPSQGCGFPGWHCSEGNYSVEVSPLLMQPLIIACLESDFLNYRLHSLAFMQLRGAICLL